MSTFDFTAKDIGGAEVDLAKYKGKVLLIVNTASECGFTPQYKGLEKVYEQFKDKGAVVLGFPCNQFKGQEPGGEAEIGAFCEKNFGVTFPLFSKVNVNGDDAHPLFKHLKKEARGVLGSQLIKWNFTKFLVKKDGSVYKRYAPATKPEEMVKDIEMLLAE
ncbi:MAG: glutathione peroxidase [Massilia sp.]|jgi:glutathione peroxidase